VQGKPTILFFFKGHGCLHCVQQMTAFTDHYQEFQRKGIQLIGVTSDTGDALKKALQDFPCPFTLLADPTGVAFASYGCTTADGLQHGTFTLDASHKITWGTVGASPFLAVTELLKDSPPPVNAEGKQKPIENTQAALFQKN
jgi:peroxiredoxin